MEEENKENKAPQGTGAYDQQAENRAEDIIRDQQDHVAEAIDAQQAQAKQAAQDLHHEQEAVHPQPTVKAAKAVRQRKPLPKFVMPIVYLVIAIVVSGSCGYLGASLASKKAASSTVVYQSTSSPVTTTATSQDDVSAVVSAVADSVVEVYTEQASYSTFYGNYVTNGAGSGVVYTADGYIITNNHVIADATSIKVTLHTGDTYDATLVATDSTADIAVIKIAATGLHPVVLGDSNNLKVGELAIAIGNPLGTLGGTVTTGIISALSRTIKIDGQQMTLLQTSAAINPGNSGGGLFNAAGELVGIVNAKSVSTSSGTTAEGLGFAIPVDVVKQVAEQLISQGYVTGRPQIGIQGVSIDSVQAAWQYGVSTYGVYVSKVTSDSATKAGLKAGDLITKMDDTEIASYDDLKSALSTHTAGDTVTLTVIRDKQTVTLTITLIEKTA